MANFSQGEWLINSHLDITCNGRYVAFVCYSNPITPLNNQSTVHANARLIAAAPKMYELLKLCVKTEKPANYIPVFLDLKDKARELLALIDEKEA